MRTKLILILSCCSLAYAQPSRISDNSFLIEEAYNQERGVVQHIVLLDKDWHTKDLGLSFAQEWPLGGQMWQGAYAVSADWEFKEVWLDLQLRYQLWSRDGLAVAPSIAFSTSTAIKEANSQIDNKFRVGIPISSELSQRLAFHLNGSIESYGYTQSGVSGAFPSQLGMSYSAYVPELGGSLVYQIKPTLDILVECIYSKTIKIFTEDITETTVEAVISPGFRHAWNFSSGAQMVGGFGLPIGLTDDVPDVSGLFYLSFEHSFLKQ